MDEDKKAEAEVEYEAVDAELLAPDHEALDLKKANDFYELLREKITKWALEKGGEKGLKTAEILLLAPDLFMLLIRLLQDSRTPVNQKVWIGIGITYFISPLDLMPEAILGPFGYLDDVVLAVFIVNKILNSHKQLVLENWSGKGDVLTIIQEVSAKAEELVGKQIYKQLQRIFDKK